MTICSSSRIVSTLTEDIGSSILVRLRTSRTALRFRQGVWELLTADGSEQKTLSRKLASVVEKLVEEGALRCGDDGLFRPHGVSSAAVTDRQASPLRQVLRARAQSGEDYFSADLVRAGEKLRDDYEKAHLSQRVTVNYSGAEGGGSRHWQFSDNAIEKFTDEVFAARQRVHEALEAVGPELSGLLLQICCLTTGFETAERLLSLPQRSGKAVLALGLMRLARHYGFRARLRHAGPTRIGHWAAEGYRPEITPDAHALHQPECD